jgi:hypothetical protein
MKRSWPNLRFYPSSCLQGLRKISKNLSQDSRSPGRDLNAGHAAYEAEVLTTRPWHTVFRRTARPAGDVSICVGLYLARKSQDCNATYCYVQRFCIRRIMKLEHLNAYMRIILKRILNKQGVRIGLDSSDWQQRTGISGGLLWTQLWTFGFHNRQIRTWTAESPSASQSLCFTCATEYSFPRLVCGRKTSRRYHGPRVALLLRSGRVPCPDHHHF